MAANSLRAVIDALYHYADPRRASSSEEQAAAEGVRTAIVAHRAAEDAAKTKKRPKRKK